MVSRFESGARSNRIERVLRRCRSREYFTGDGWTENPKEARILSDVVEAAVICAQHGLNDVELAIRFQAGTCDVFCTRIR